MVLLTKKSEYIYSKNVYEINSWWKHFSLPDLTANINIVWKKYLKWETLAYLEPGPVS